MDFLGVGNLVKSGKNPHAKHSENEIYQHITNCQQFWSYNVDETKLLKRRRAFNASIAFLFKLTERGNVLEASRYASIRWLKGLFARGKENAITALGFRVAENIYAKEKDLGRVTAIFLLIALDTAYQNVLSVSWYFEVLAHRLTTNLQFTAVLNSVLVSMYDVAEGNNQDPQKAERDRKTSNKWLEIQSLAFKSDRKSFERTKELVLDERRTSVKLPFVKIALENAVVESNGKKLTVSAGQSIICDIVSLQDDSR
jgi:hypothetical protein